MFGSGLYQSVQTDGGIRFLQTLLNMPGQSIFQETGGLAQSLCDLIQTGGLLFQRSLHPVLCLYL